MSKTTIPTAGLADAAVTTAKITDANITTAKIADDAVTTAKSTAGITMVDQWRLTTDFTGIANPITSNLEQNDSSGNGVPLGSSMTQSSGVFTFPSTGIYMIIANLQGRGNDGSSGVTDSEFRLTTKVTTDNSSYTEVAFNGTGMASGHYCATTSHYIFDVTDTTQCKCSFRVFVNVDAMTHGDSGKNETHFTFIRLGDT
jgi:hypothetical protein